MGTPRDPEAQQSNRLALVKRAADKTRKAENERAAAIRFAHEAGAPYRAIAEAADLSHMTIKRIIDGEPPA